MAFEVEKRDLRREGEEGTTPREGTRVKGLCPPEEKGGGPEREGSEIRDPGACGKQDRNPGPKERAGGGGGSVLSLGGRGIGEEAVLGRLEEGQRLERT